MEYIETGTIGYIIGYRVVLEGQNLEVFKQNKMITVQAVRLGIDHFLAFLQTAKDIRLGWAQLQDDGDEVIYIYDKADDYFGYAINLHDITCSEWGYAPFRTF